jgi:hypothetical protein
MQKETIGFPSTTRPTRLLRQTGTTGNVSLQQAASGKKILEPEADKLKMTAVEVIALMEKPVTGP